MTEAEKKLHTAESDRETEQEVIRLSVRALVEFMLRSGDIDARRGGWADREAMQVGARAHRKIQKSRGPAYRAEVPLKWDHAYPSCRLLLEGRADGIYEQDGIPVIEEIKGTYGDPEKLEEPVPVHLAQARCYAFIYAHEKACEKIRICMTYVQLETEEVRRFFCNETYEELESWFRRLLDGYERWAEFRVKWIEKRGRSLRGLPFPFPYREGQKKLAEDIYRTILRKKQVFVQAPTGVGKTISTVYPSLIAMGEGLTSRIFYLTAKTAARSVAEESVRILTDKGLTVKCLTLTAKEKICPLQEMHCDPMNCPYAKGHFDRINEILFRTLQKEDTLERTTLQKAAEEGRVCPYEMQADLTQFADMIICDYNYVFDPTARLKQFFGEGQGRSDTVFLIDEAHNLVDRARDMFSADLTREEFMSLRRAVKEKKEGSYKKLGTALKSCTDRLLVLRKEAETEEKPVSAGELITPLLRCIGQTEDLLSEMQDGELREQLLAFYFRISAFVQIYELADDNYVTYGYPAGKHDFYLKVFCVNPSGNLQKVLDKGRSAVFFSATLIPVRYYRELLSGREDDYAIAVPSPFPEKNRKILIASGVSTKYERRTETEYRQIAGCIAAAVSARPGRYMVYFPSYQMLEEVAILYAEMAGEEETLLLQSRDMREEEKEEFLRTFRTSREGTLTGFCVMGGSFAEGIDLYGESLMGAVVVGTGIPQIGRERELLKQFYGKNVFAYAYRIPGMNKVLQAAGRVIRTMQDTGWILLLDERFLQREYAGYFPPSWKDRETCAPGEVGARIREFWLTILT